MSDLGIKLEQFIGRRFLDYKAPWSADDAHTLSAEVNGAMYRSIHSRIHELKSAYLIHRRDPVGASIMTLRPYLRIPVPGNRTALTRLILDQHSLASRRGRWTDEDRDALPREDRLCRLCHSDVETPEHALLACEGSSALLDLRMDFWARACDTMPGLRGIRGTYDNVLALLITKSPISSLLGSYAASVLQLFDEVPMV